MMYLVNSTTVYSIFDAAFNTINYSYLNEKFCSFIILSDTVLGWFCSYLFDYTISVYSFVSHSDLSSIRHEVLQGFVLGSFSFSFYFLPFGLVTYAIGVIKLKFILEFR